jgi:prepilin-type processing-associated H-X9-DG protein
MTPTEQACMQALRQGGPMSIRAIDSRLDCGYFHVSRALASLTRAGMIHCKPIRNRHPGRPVNVYWIDGGVQG